MEIGLLFHVFIQLCINKMYYYKRMKLKINPRSKLFNLILTSILYTIGMITGVFATGYLSQGETFLGLVFLFFTFSTCFLIGLYSFFINRKDKLLFVEYLLDSVFFLSLTFLTLFAPNFTIEKIIGIVFGVSLIINAILSLIHRHKVGDIIFNIFKSIFGLLLVLVFLVIRYTEGVSFLSLIPICIFFIA